MDETKHLETARLRKPARFSIEPKEAERKDIALRLGLVDLKKLNFAGQVAPDGHADFRLEATLGATAVQACVVTSDPVTTRIDTDVIRQYLADMPMPEGDEVEMPEDDTREPLPATIDLTAVMEEALVLALPDWPRADGVEQVDITVTAPGITPMSDEDAKPFAGLKALRDKLGPGEDDT